MSQVRKHNNSTLLSMDGKMNPEPQTGDMVRNFYDKNNVGLVLEVIDKVQCKVLWSEYYNPWASFTHVSNPGTVIVIPMDSHMNIVSLNYKINKS